MSDHEHQPKPAGGLSAVDRLVGRHVSTEKEDMKKMTHAEWKAEGQRRFGTDPRAWRFVCPSCGHVASVQDWKDAGAPDGAVAFSCLGRYTGDGKAAADKAFKHAGGPCNYTGGGLLRLNPVEVDFGDGSEPMQAFAFAEVTANDKLQPRAE